MEETQMVNIRIDKKLHHAFKLKCVDLGLTMKDVVERFIKVYVNDDTILSDKKEAKDGNA